jgi:hypothetical protein
VQCIDYGEPEAGKRHDDDEENGDGGDNAGDWADLRARHFRQRFTVAANRRGENDEIMHRAADTHTDDEPEQTGEKAELRRERADQRTGAGDRGEMMVNSTHLFVGVMDHRSSCVLA